MVAARSAASATFRLVLLAAAPISAKVFHFSSMTSTRCRASRTQTSIGRDGSDGRGEWSTERHAKSHPELEWDGLAAPEFDPADPRLMDADAGGQLGLGQTEADPSVPHRLAKGVSHRPRTSGGLADRLGRPSPRRCSHLHSHESYIRAFTDGYATWQGLPTLGRLRQMLMWVSMGAR
jgi:hypothetical protein